MIHSRGWLGGTLTISLLGGMAPLAHALTTVTDIDYLNAGIQLPPADIELYNNEQSGIRLNGALSLYGYGAVTRNANFGARESIGGATTKRHPAWWEASLVPILTGEADMPGGSRLFGGVKGVLSMTRGNQYGDIDGATPGHPEHGRVDLAYLGWNSGTLLADSLGEDALSLSFGRQKFEFGDGFLVGDGYSDTGKYAGYYIGPSEGFQNSVVASIDSHGWHGDLFHLKQDQYVQGGSDQQTYANGANVDYTWDGRAKFGAAYVHTYHSDTASREGMDVYNLRAKGVPFEAIPDLSLGGQYVHEDNSKAGINDDGWYAQATYTFSNVKWTPQLMYRYAEFSENYDTLFYDFAGGWGNWYMGEIVGEYMLFNSNLKVDMIRASIQPNESLEAGVIGYRFRYKDTPDSVTSRDFAKEVDLYADWNLTDSFALSGVYGVAFPDRGAKQTFNTDHTSQLFQVFATYTF
ncbi:alginate export family protein [Phytohalomonas tamaricis]|uniref:alginate export family protein n=1 Tax=Phytohalomonas tamaricis TaxID=2081032 RepID=UPI00131A32C1|nr:alginate export family protein [Phytohalomonas tamaricis]